ncbi:MAG TPA: anion permease [Alphaproteobacteria bacterium]|jgi:PiT family inorganic phosphate transporter|nr:anion permease [Alphaproteobacteria bacterium]
MLNFAPSSTEALIALIFCFILVCVFEFANGFHDTANAVATVIYTNSLKPRIAVVWSGFMNFLGVMLGGIAVAYALVELLPADVLSPPNGNPAVPMLVSLFATALAWNLFTWWFGIPNSSSHCVIGALIGVALGNAFVNSRNLAQGVDWTQIWTVLRALAVSPILGLIGAGALYFGLRHLVKDRHLYEPPKDGKPPVGWVRGMLILTCTTVSFSHGSNDGQKSIGLIMLTIIGLMPATFALNPDAQQQIEQLAQNAAAAQPLIAKYGDDEKQLGVEAANHLQQAGPSLKAAKADLAPGFQRVADGAIDQPGAGQQGGEKATRSAIRDAVYRVVGELKYVTKSKDASKEEKAEATRIRAALRPSVEYAPWWVRLLSALCLGVGTMVGYKRIVTTLGERVGKAHLTPAQGASAELVGALLIGSAGFTGLPVSTTHIITSGIAGTMLGSGAGINPKMLTRIALAWILTLPVTIAVAAGLFYILSARP